MTKGWNFRIQAGVFVFFSLFVFSFIAWIISRAYVTTAMRDAGGATVAIAFVLVPVFVILYSTFSFVFWTIVRDRSPE